MRSVNVLEIYRDGHGELQHSSAILPRVYWDDSEIFQVTGISEALEGELEPFEDFWIFFYNPVPMDVPEQYKDNYFPPISGRLVVNYAHELLHKQYKCRELKVRGLP